MIVLNSNRWLKRVHGGNTVPSGNLEYSVGTDRGVNMSFWDSRQDVSRCRTRMRALMDLFGRSYYYCYYYLY